MAVITAAHTLSDNGYVDKEEIIPTLVFAALSEDIPELAKIRHQFAAAEQDAEEWKNLHLRFHNTFQGFSPERYVDGVLILKHSLISVNCVYEPSTGVIKKFEIITYDLSIRSGDVASYYEEALSLRELGYTRSDVGDIGWKIYPGAIRMAVRPEDPDIDPVRRHTLRSADEQLPFPPPGLVGEVYGILRGSNAKGKFPGFGRMALRGKTHGPRADSKTLIPACIAWYLSRRGRAAESQHEYNLTNLLIRQSVLDDQERTSAHEQLWDNVKKRSNAIQDMEQDLLSGISRLGKHPRDKYL